MRKGDKIKCIESYQCELTVGKEYDVYHQYNNVVSVYCDNKILNTYSKHYFTTKKQSRIKKLNRILDYEEN